MSRVGAWFIGARGSVATTATVGALAMQARLVGRTGMVTDHPDLAEAGLVDLDDVVVGGHDIACTPLPKRAEMLADAGVVPTSVVAALRDELAEVDARIRPGLQPGEEAPDIDRLVQDLRDFRDRYRLERVVVVNVSSTEPPAQEHAAHADVRDLEAALAAGEPVLPASSLYSVAALRAGCAFVDFTPSTGLRLPALRQLADRLGLPWAGSDGKTGETLVKSVLAPMFAARNLRVRSWSGTNLLGGGDGATLADPAAAQSKSISKGGGLPALLGYDVDSPLHIDYVPDLGDWKTAWDHVSFEGFLGTRMNLQFTWQGCDSALAAPLVIDLVRLLALALARGSSGSQPQLGFFFKDPVDTSEHALHEQWRALVAWVRDVEVTGS